MSGERVLKSHLVSGLTGTLKDYVGMKLILFDSYLYVYVNWKGTNGAQCFRVAKKRQDVTDGALWALRRDTKPSGL